MDNDFLPYHERNSFAFIKLYDLINDLMYLLYLFVFIIILIIIIIFFI
jgi:hypothetical protein